MHTTLPTLTLVASFTAAALMLPSTASAAESYDNCTGFITSIPATLTTQGTWCLSADLSTSLTSGAAITISNNNITIDCNDFKLGGLGAGVGTAMVGIRATNRLNTTVRHCNVRGFNSGVQLTGASGGGHVVEDNRFDGNTSVGIDVAGDGSIVRRNIVRDTGGSTANAGIAIGIRGTSAVDVIDNTVSGVLPAPSGGNGDAIGIRTVSNPNGSINANRVRGLAALGTGAIIAIENVTSGRISLVDNQVAGNVEAGSVGLTCSTINGRASNNIVNGFIAPIVGCSNDGNVAP